MMNMKTRSTNIIIGILLLFSMKSVNAQVDLELANDLQTVIDNSVFLNGNNGVSAHLIMPNGNVWSGTAGIGKDDLVISDTTLFHGASTTKMNIAALIMLLAEEGLIDLDNEWSNYVTLNTKINPLITVRQLLNHTSGIADYLETSSSGILITSDFNAFFTPQYILENIVSDIPVFTPGTNFQYSNSNYLLAAFIVESITGHPIQTELKNRIWNPLGMNHTYFGGYDSYTEPTAGVWWNFGNGFSDYSDEPTTSMLSYAYGAGNIVSCPTDLALFLSGMLDGQLLTDESLEEMMDFVPSSFTSWTEGYGLGIHHASGQSEDIVIGHDGYYSNLTSMFHSTEYGFTLVTMTNTQTQWYGIFNPMYETLSAYFKSTHVSETPSESDLVIFPNPSISQIKISSQQTINKVIINDAVGRVYYSATPNSKIISVDIDVDGLYFITAITGLGSITKRMIVKK
jgi:D-alanyl-D-alanine carboxypeptidase